LKSKAIFLISFLGYSLLLFTFRHQFFDSYIYLLEWSIDLINPYYYFKPAVRTFLYSSSLTMLAFIALVLSTPGLSIAKRAGTLCSGACVFFFMDFFAVQYLVFPEKGSHEETFIYELYLSSKWLLPFLLWIIMSYSTFGSNFRIFAGDKTS
jgi:hypothetical protein